MTIPHWFLIAGFVVFVLITAGLLRKSLQAWRTADHASPKGNPLSGALYSVTGAMLPWKKESASLYPVSYLLGVLYHVGSFVGFGWVAVLFFDVAPPAAVVSASAVLIGLAAAGGVGLLVKRITNPNLRYFSSPDDYFSNLLVTGWQVVIVLTLLYEAVLPALLVLTGMLFIYMPLGKLRHAIYFLPARVYLGLFYGRRGVWPARRRRA
jgi:nitrate reductase gamma subunit